MYLFDLHVTINKKSKVEDHWSIKKNDFKRWIETTKTEQKLKLAGHLLLDSEAVWDMEETKWSNMFTDFSLSFFHICLQSLPVKTTKIHGYSKTMNRWKGY